VRAIAKDALNAYKYTGKGNLVAVISERYWTLGLGNLGPLGEQAGYGRPKGVLYQRLWAGIEYSNIEC